MHRFVRTSLLLAIACSVAACESEPPPPPPVELSIRMHPESGPIHTNGSVRLELEVQGEPDSVEIIRDGELIAELGAARSWDWDTTADDEETYTLSAIARSADSTVESEPLTVVVDRTPPRVVSVSPTTFVLVGTYAIHANFSEPLDPASITPDAVRMWNKAGAEVPLTLMLASDRRLVSVLPTGRVNEGRYCVEAGGFRDLAGNASKAAQWCWDTQERLEKVELSVVGTPGVSVVTREPIEFRVSLEGAPLQVTLMRNGQWVGEVEGGRFPWNLTMAGDGMHVFHAIARYVSHEVESNVVNVNVDRTRPRAVPTFKSFLTTRELGDLQFDLSEPLAASSLNDRSVIVSSERGNPARRSVIYTEGSWSLRLQVKGSSSPDRLVLTLNDGVTDVAGNSMMPTSVHAVVSDWKGLAGPLNENGPQGGDPAAASLPDGRPVVAWTDQGFDRAANVRVRRWSGTKWTALPEPTDGNATIAFEPAVALTPNDQPIVAWTERTDDRRAANLHVSRWDGTAWTRLGDASLNEDPECDAITPALASDAAGNPTVAWIEGTTCLLGSPAVSTNLRVKRWTGVGWESLETGDVSASAYPSLAVAIDRQGMPVIAWIEDRELRVRRWDGGAWVRFPSDPFPVPPSGTFLSRPKLAIDPSGRVILAVAEQKLGAGTSVNAVHVSRFDFEEWVKLGPVVEKRPTWIGSVSLVLDRGGEPIVAWGEIGGAMDGVPYDGTAYVSRWDGRSWIGTGPGECFAGAFDGRGMALATDRERPVVALSQSLPVENSILVRSPE